MKFFFLVNVNPYFIVLVVLFLGERAREREKKKGSPEMEPRQKREVQAGVNYRKVSVCCSCTVVAWGRGGEG